jgi:hypothetical protein
MPRAAAAAPPPANIWMPTRKQLRSTYEGEVQGQADAGKMTKLSRAPAGAKDAVVFKNVGIDGVKGREDIFEIGGRLYMKNTQDTKTTWYRAGDAPVF